MKNYIDEYCVVTKFKEDNPKLSEQVEKAYHLLKRQYPNAEEDEFVVIKVEGYYCVACIIDFFTPKELGRTIQPFDEKQVYPMQGLVTEYEFERF